MREGIIDSQKKNFSDYNKWQGITANPCSKHDFDNYDKINPKTK